MIRIYVMQTCPGCAGIKEQVEGAAGYEVVDIGAHVRNLRQFVHLRDTHPAFDGAKANGSLGIPCFVLDDGSVEFDAAKAGLRAPAQREAPSCSIDGTGC